MNDQFFIDYETEYRHIYHKVKSVIFSSQTKYQQVKILDTYQFGLMLILDGKIQSAEADEYIYHEALVHPAMFTHSHPLDVLILGAGEGATAKEVLKHRSVKRVTMIDIDEELVQICRQRLTKWHKGSFDDPRCEVLYVDAIKYVKECTHKFDVVIADLSDPLEGGCSQLAYTLEFYQSVHNVLKADGIFVTQAAELYHDSPTVHSIIHKTISSVFASTASYSEYIPSFASMWGFIIASKQKSDFKAKVSLDLELLFYTPKTHQRMFTLAPAVTKAIQTQSLISTEANPISVYHSLKA